MFEEIAHARQLELLANARKITTMAAWEETSRLEQLQRSVRVARARLGLLAHAG